MRRLFLCLFLSLSFAAISQDHEVLHYWDDYDFEDPYVFIEGDIMLNYFVHLKEAPYEISNESIYQTLDRASRNNQIFSLFIDTYRVYLMNPESLFCDYERYLAVAEYVIANERISQLKKSEFLLEKEIINTNKTGDIATDFVVTDKNGNPIELFNIKTDYVLVFFHNPNCGICIKTKEDLSNSEIINQMIDNGDLTVFVVCPYDEYELWNATDYPEKWLNGIDKEGRINEEKLYYFMESSSLYLLDKEKRVVKKDIRLDLLEDYLSDLLHHRQH